MARPSDYTPELATKICLLIIDGHSLRKICERDDMPDKATVFRWLADPEKKEFCDQYARAREVWAEDQAEEIIEIADDTAGDTIDEGDGKTRTNHENVQRSRLRVDTRKWLMSRMFPKKYGDRSVTELQGKDGGPIETKELSEAETARRLAFLLTRGAKAAEKEANDG